MDVPDNANGVFCIQWNQHQSTIITALESLLQRDRLIDVQLEAEGKFINAHRLVLSSCSPYFEALLSQPVYKKNKKETIIFLDNVPFADATALVDFMYKGVVNISKEQMPSFMHTAELLQIKGLTLTDFESRNKLVKTAPPSMTHLIESSKEIVDALANSKLSGALVSVESPNSAPSTSSKNHGPSSSAVPYEAIASHGVDNATEKRMNVDLVLNYNPTHLESASQNETLMLNDDIPKEASVPDPIESTSDDSVIAGASHSSSTGYTRLSRRCKSSVGSYVVHDGVCPTLRISDEFKPYMCEKCGRSYMYKGRLDYHKRLACGYIPPPKSI